MSDEKEQPRKAQAEVTPLDLMICKFQSWVEEMEKLEAEQRARKAERTAIPDDVPRFVTRYP